MHCLGNHHPGDSIASKREVCLSAQATKRLARACQGLPRKAEQLIWKLPYHVRPDQGQISIEDVRNFLRANGLNAHGWGPRERRYLRYLHRFGSASLDTLAL